MNKTWINEEHKYNELIEFVAGIFSNELELLDPFKNESLLKDRLSLTIKWVREGKYILPIGYQLQDLEDLRTLKVFDKQCLFSTKDQFCKLLLVFLDKIQDLIQIMVNNNHLYSDSDIEQNKSKLIDKIIETKYKGLFSEELKEDIRKVFIKDDYRGAHLPIRYQHIENLDKLKREIDDLREDDIDDNDLNFKVFAFEIDGKYIFNGSYYIELFDIDYILFSEKLLNLLSNSNTLNNEHMFEVTIELTKSWRLDEAINYLERMNQDIKRDELLIKFEFLRSEIYKNKYHKQVYDKSSLYIRNKKLEEIPYINLYIHGMSLYYLGEYTGAIKFLEEYILSGHNCIYQEFIINNNNKRNSKSMFMDFELTENQSKYYILDSYIKMGDYGKAYSFYKDYVDVFKNSEESIETKNRIAYKGLKNGIENCKNLKFLDMNRLFYNKVMRALIVTEDYNEAIFLSNALDGNNLLDYDSKNLISILEDKRRIIKLEQESITLKKEIEKLELIKAENYKTNSLREYFDSITGKTDKDIRDFLMEQIKLKDDENKRVNELLQAKELEKKAIENEYQKIIEKLDILAERMHKSHNKIENGINESKEITKLEAEKTRALSIEQAEENRIRMSELMSKVSKVHFKLITTESKLDTLRNFNNNLGDHIIVMLEKLNNNQLLSLKNDMIIIGDVKEIKDTINNLIDGLIKDIVDNIAKLSLRVNVNAQDYLDRINSLESQMIKNMGTMINEIQDSLKIAFDSTNDNILEVYFDQSKEFTKLINQLEGIYEEFEMFTQRLEIADKLNEEVNEIKNNTWEINNKLDEIYSIISKALEKDSEIILKNTDSNTFNQIRIYYKEKFSEKNWDRLSESEQRTLITSRIIYNDFDKRIDKENLEYSPVVIGLTKVLESVMIRYHMNRLLKNRDDIIEDKFYSLKDIIYTFPSIKLKIGNEIRYIDQWMDDKDNLNLYNRSIDDYSIKFKKDFEESKFRVIYNNELFSKNTKNEEKFKGFAKNMVIGLQYVRRNHRNKAAHNEFLSRSTADDCYAKLVEVDKLLKLFLDNVRETSPI